MNRTILALVGLIVLGAAALAAWNVPQAGDPAVLLRAAIEKEEVDGNLDAAIEQYKQVIKVAGANRTVAAQALLRLGGCYEKRGPKEARRTYEQLIRDFGEQGREVAIARQRLATLAKSAAQQQPTFRRISIPSKRSTYGTGKLSPDGQTLAFVEGGSLWTVPVHGKSDPNIAGASTRLTEPMHAWDTANICIEWSIDGKWIGFLVQVPQADKPSVQELYVVPAAGGAPRRLHVRSERTAGAAYTLRYALSADAEALYFAAGRPMEELRIYSMPARGGSPQPITPPITRDPALSPDGSRLAYARGENFKGVLLTKEVWVAAADGTGARLVYRVPGPGPAVEVRGPVWSPDGGTLAFLVSAGTAVFTHAMVLPLPDAGIAPAEPVRIDLPVSKAGTNDLLAGWTRDNRLGVLIPNEERTAIYTIPTSGGRAVQLTPKSGASPAWTPDSRRIYFHGTHGGDKLGLEVVAAEGGPIERVPLDGSFMPSDSGVPPGGYDEKRWGFISGPSMAPDGQLFCFSGAEMEARRTSPGIFTLSTRGGTPTRLTTGPDVEPIWSADGARIAFVRATQTGAASNVFVIPREGGEPRQLTTDADRVASGSVAWSPDARAIAFKGIDKTLRVVPVAGGPSRVLAEVAVGDLAWSPDGQTLAYVSAGALWRIPAVGGAPARIETGLDARLGEIALSPDGKRIAFSATSGGEHDLWLIENFLPFAKGRR